ncbi:hypothetical protein V3W47_17785 [Deinococcus sp. YIM 134068]|uniref:hypothetical protein n=1 Tax=Deinococcus lichenicola TaxID=3118910 RepID=UPI002F91F491
MLYPSVIFNAKVAKSLSAIGIAGSVGSAIDLGTSRYTEKYEGGPGDFERWTTIIYVPLINYPELYLLIQEIKITNYLEVSDRLRQITSYISLVGLYKTEYSNGVFRSVVYDPDTNTAALSITSDSENKLTTQSLDGTFQTASLTLTFGMNPSLQSTRNLFTSPSVGSLSNQSTMLKPQTVTYEKGAGVDYCVTRIVRGEDVTTCYSGKYGSYGYTVSYPDCMPFWNAFISAQSAFYDSTVFVVGGALALKSSMTAKEKDNSAIGGSALAFIGTLKDSAVKAGKMASANNSYAECRKK